MDVVPPAKDASRRTLNFEKCSLCRQVRQKVSGFEHFFLLRLIMYSQCLPVDRIWPARCDRCVSKGLPCSRPQKKQAEPRQRAAREPTVTVSTAPLPAVSENGQRSESISRRQEEVDASRAQREMSPHGDTSQRDYGYTSLENDEFRVLELKRGSVNDEIVCELHLWHGHTQYEAVSYLRSFVEGMPITMLTDRGKRRPKKIMPNLYAALKHLRLLDRSRFLWINALCIDHSNTPERNVQVHAVHKIFSQASNVCLWLGETDGSTDGKISMAFEFAVQLLEPKFFDDASNDIGAVGKWRALLDLISHPLFERRWVAQEVAVAGEATIHYGQNVMNWSDFADVVTMFEHTEHRYRTISRLFRRSPDFNRHSDVIGDVQALGASRFVNLTSSIFKKCNSGSNMGDDTKSLLSLEELVFQLASFKGWDPHDVIYACVSLSQESRGTGTMTVPELSCCTRKAINRFLALIRRKVNWTEKSGALSSGKLHSAEGTVFALLQSEGSDIDSKREIDTFVSRGQCKRVMYNVNYDLPVLSTYKEFIAHVLRETKTLGILCRPWAPSEQVLADYIDGGVPSWIATLDRAAFGKSPTFASYVRINANPLIGPPGKEPYKASLGLPAVWTFPAARSGQNRLHVQGFVLTTISERRNAAVGGNIPLKWLQLVGWDRRNVKSEEKMVAGELVGGPLRQTIEEPSSAKDSGEELPPENFWRTLVADRGPNGSYAPVFYRRACQYAFKQSGVASAINTEDLLDSIKLSMVKEFLQRVQEVVWNRQLIKTKRGYLGLAPEAAEKGDLVCILYGCSVPVVIREVEGGDHELVGECYIHGMMDGAALGVQVSQKIPKKMFTLR
jgi:hypothetical protein